MRKFPLTLFPPKYRCASYDVVLVTFCILCLILSLFFFAQLDLPRRQFHTHEVGPVELVITLASFHNATCGLMQQDGWLGWV